MEKKKMGIKDLKIDTAQKLTGEIKNRLAKIIEEEFVNRTTKFNSDLNEKKSKYLEVYRKKIGFSKLVKKIDSKQAELDRAKSDLFNLGLDLNGEIKGFGYSEHNEVGEKKAKEISSALVDIKNASQPVNTLRNKLLARLWVSSTMGEALVMLNEVLGNGILPTLTRNDFKQLPDKTNENNG